MTLRLPRAVNWTEKHKLWIPFQHVDTSDQRRWGHTQRPSSVPLFSDNTLPLFPRLYLKPWPFFFSLLPPFTVNLSSYSIPHFCCPWTIFPFPPPSSYGLPLPPSPLMCGVHPVTSCTLVEPEKKCHHHYGTGKRQQSFSCYILRWHFSGNRDKLKCFPTCGMHVFASRRVDPCYQGVSVYHHLNS